MAIYVYSTLNNDQSYTTYEDVPGGSPKKESVIFIAGKASFTSKYLIPPSSIVTEITAEQLTGLRQNQVFKLHEKSGFISVSQAMAVPDKVGISVADLTVLMQLPQQRFEKGKAPVIRKSTGKGKA